MTISRAWPQSSFICGFCIYMWFVLVGFCFYMNKWFGKFLDISSHLYMSVRVFRSVRTHNYSKISGTDPHSLIEKLSPPTSQPLRCSRTLPPSGPLQPLPTPFWFSRTHLSNSCVNCVIHGVFCVRDIILPRKWPNFLKRPLRINGKLCFSPKIKFVKTNFNYSLIKL